MNKNGLREIELFLFDMDGTIYLEDKLIEGSLELLELLKTQNKEYVFLTNNSSKSVKTYLKKLTNMGIVAVEKNMFTSSQATAMYLLENYKKPKVYCVGTEDFKKELEAYDIIVRTTLDYDIDCVVVGFDTELNYEKIKIACELISSGKDFIATNMDLVCPVKGGKFIPDCGAICNLITTAVNIEPKYIGKPNKDMVEIISNIMNIDKDKIAVVGDRLYTDIAIGINSGIKSICVLTGETNKDDIESSDIKPTYIFNSVKDIYNIIK